MGVDDDEGGIPHGLQERPETTAVGVTVGTQLPVGAIGWGAITGLLDSPVSGLFEDGDEIGDEIGSLIRYVGNRLGSPVTKSPTEMFIPGFYTDHKPDAVQRFYLIGAPLQHCTAESALDNMTCLSREQSNSLGEQRRLLGPISASADLEPELTDKEREKIRRGVILLEDAYQGRASHGLYSLLDGPAWKRVLFVIHTNDWWGTLTISASALHALLILFEAPTYREAWLDPALNTTTILLCEGFCIAVYIVDIAMKMLYYGGWRDYVSKGWQRMYAQIVAAMTLDWLLFYCGLCTLRFSRPIRLTILCGRHRDVRRIGAFLPVMGQRLLTTFAAPMTIFITIFGVLGVRLWGDLPAPIQESMQGYTFASEGSALRTLFMLSTMDNFDAVVLNLYRHSAGSFWFFLVFIVIAGFFLMSVSIGVIGDVYNEDQEERTETERKKSKKSLEKAFDKLDIAKSGSIPLAHFAEMMRHIRPDKQKHHHAFMFHLIANEKGVLDKSAFRRMKQFLRAQFVMEHRLGNEHLHSFRAWKKFQSLLVRVDAIILAMGIDNMALLTLRLGAGSTFVLELGTLSLAACVLWVVSLFAASPTLFVQKYRKTWMKTDLAILTICALSNLMYVSCASGNHVCQPSTKRAFEAAAAARTIRVFLLYGPSRLYLKAVWQLAELIKFFMGVVATYNYMFAVLGMEILARDPTQKKGTELPSFDTFPKAFVTTFQVFIGAWSDVLTMHDATGPPWLAAIVSVFLILTYSVMTIGLCNLLTNIVVDFNSVLQEAAKQSKETKFAKMATASPLLPAKQPPESLGPHAASGVEGAGPSASFRFPGASVPNNLNPERRMSRTLSSPEPAEVQALAVSRGMVTRGKSFIQDEGKDEYEMMVVKADQDCIIQRYLVPDASFY